MKYLVVSLLILILGIFGVGDIFRFYVKELLTPIQFGLSNQAQNILDAKELYENIAELNALNKNLELELSLLKSEYSQLHLESYELALLREQLNIKDSLDFEFELLVATTYSNPIDETNKTIYIDKGSKHDVKVNSNVIISNQLVGLVTEVYPDSSLVTLITSPTFKTPVFTGKDFIEGIVQGRYDFILELTKILPEEQIFIGDYVYSSSRTDVVTPNLVLGQIEEINDQSSNSERRVFITPLFELNNLKRVFVIL
jgi:rod shape-determining protein MreC